MSASVAQTVLTSVLPRGFPSYLSDAASKVLGFDQVDQAYDALRTKGGAQPLFERLLQFMKVTYTATPADLSQIPKKGAAVIVANHPFGMIEAAVLVTAARQIRPDVRVLANHLLTAVPELQDCVIPVNILSGSPRENAASMRCAAEFVGAGGLLIVFPAGAVSHFHWSQKNSVDPPWHPAIARLVALIAKIGKPPVVVPAFVPGANGIAFHLAGLLHPGFRTALLVRELLNKRDRSVELRFGRPIPFEKLASMPSDDDRIQYLRWRTYLLARRNSFKPSPVPFFLKPQAWSNKVAVIEPEPSAILGAEVDGLPAACLLERSNDLAVYLASSAQIPKVLREIGRLREVTFRQAGEGTCKALDLDRFDEKYQHLFVWNAAKQEVVGAYRLQTTGRAHTLYTRTLFHFDETFLNKMGPAVELGRSFIRAEYQKGFAPLLLLWKGIGKFVAANPRYKTLFGPVSISNQYQAISREIMIAFLEKRASITEWRGLVRARNAFRSTGERGGSECRDLEELSDLISDLEPTQAGIPVLLRQYLKLGGKLIGFNVDPEFSNALDGLIVVDLSKTEPKLLERYLGKAEATSFLEFHKTSLAA